MCNGTGDVEAMKASFECESCEGTGKIKERFSLIKRKWVAVKKAPEGAKE